VLAAGTGGVIVGWLSCSSPRVCRWILAAGSQQPTWTGYPARLGRATIVGGATALVAVALLVCKRGVATAEVAGLVVWASALAVLGLVDSRHFVVPTALVRLSALATGGFLLGAGGLSGDWQCVVGGVGCALVAGGLFAVWAVAKPQGLGFGDVRMACLVALGAGAICPAGAAVALSCAPLVAGVLSRHRANTGARGAAPVPLGPLLAVGGIVAVVASAF
jgi:leader peptidase (prepilin peptidase)/N-methyltransferase